MELGNRDVHYRGFVHLLSCLHKIEMIYYGVQKCHQYAAFEMQTLIFLTVVLREEF